MSFGRGDVVVVAIQSSKSFIFRSGKRTETNWCDENWYKRYPVVKPGRKRCCSRKESLQAWFEHKSTSSLLSRCAEARVCNHHGRKDQICNLGGISDINWIPITGTPTKFSDKPSDVFTAKYLMLPDPSKTKMVSYSAMGRTSSTGEENVSRIVWTQSLSQHRRHRRYILGRKIPSLLPTSSQLPKH